MRLLCRDDDIPSLVFTAIFDDGTTQWYFIKVDEQQVHWRQHPRELAIFPQTCTPKYQDIGSEVLASGEISVTWDQLMARPLETIISEILL